MFPTKTLNLPVHMLNRFAGLVVSTLCITFASTCRTGASNDNGIASVGTARVLEQVLSCGQEEW